MQPATLTPEQARIALMWFFNHANTATSLTPEQFALARVLCTAAGDDAATNFVGKFERGEI